MVIAIIAILASLLSVALASAKSRARATECLNNKKQLGLVYHMYTDDNAGKLVSNRLIDDANWTSNDVSWVRQSMRWSNNEDVTPIMLSPLSLFSRYLGNTLKVYKCPEDNFYTPAQKAPGWRTRPRSISMNFFLGHDSKNISALGKNYRFLKKDSSFIKASPSDIYTILDEHPDSFELYYGATFMMPAAQIGAWNSLPGSYHRKAATVLFCDGHAIVKRWVLPSTIQPVLFEGWGDRHRGGNFNLPLDDMKWILQRTSERINDELWF